MRPAATAACGTPVGADGACPEGLNAAPDGNGGEICWADACTPPAAEKEDAEGHRARAQVPDILCNVPIVCSLSNDPGCPPTAEQCTAACGDSAVFIDYGTGVDAFFFYCGLPH